MGLDREQMQTELRALFEDQMLEKERQIEALQADNERLRKEVRRLSGLLAGRISGSDTMSSKLRDALYE